MSGPWTLRESLMLAGAVLLSLSIAYYAGKRQGSFDEKMSSNKNQIHVADSVTRSDSAKVDSVKKNADILAAYRSHAREKVVVQHDTILVRDSVVAVSPEVAQLIQADDSTIAALKNFVAAQNTEIADLRSGIALRDTRIHLLESQVTPGKFKRFATAAKWVAIGAIAGAAFVHR